MINGGQKKVLGSNNLNEALMPFSSKEEYTCANAQITRGFTSSPPTLQNCFDRFPSIKATAAALGVSSGNIWAGPGTGTGGNVVGQPKLVDVFLSNSSNECIEVAKSTVLGADWLGCLWGTPEASFSCTCPEYGPKYEAYIKLRQNVATFWNTNNDTPVKRQEFIDSVQFGPKVEFTTSGDFKYKVGSVVAINVTGISKNPKNQAFSIVNGKYWIVAIKHVITNSGTHESRLTLTQLATDSPY